MELLFTFCMILLILFGYTAGLYVKNNSQPLVKETISTCDVSCLEVKREAPPQKKQILGQTTINLPHLVSIEHTEATENSGKEVENALKQILQTNQNKVEAVCDSVTLDSLVLIVPYPMVVPMASIPSHEETDTTQHHEDLGREETTTISLTLPSFGIKTGESEEEKTVDEEEAPEYYPIMLVNRGTQTETLEESMMKTPTFAPSRAMLRILSMPETDRNELMRPEEYLQHISPAPFSLGHLPSCRTEGEHDQSDFVVSHLVSRSSSRSRHSQEKSLNTHMVVSEYIEHALSSDSRSRKALDSILEENKIEISQSQVSIPRQNISQMSFSVASVQKDEELIFPSFRLSKRQTTPPAQSKNSSEEWDRID